MSMTRDMMQNRRGRQYSSPKYYNDVNLAKQSGVTAPVPTTYVVHRLDSSVAHCR